MEGDVSPSHRTGDPAGGAFYPLTFPITAGPGCIVVTMTLSAHATQKVLLETVVAQVGLLVGIAMVSTSVFFATPTRRGSPGRSLRRPPPAC